MKAGLLAFGECLPFFYSLIKVDHGKCACHFAFTVSVLYHGGPCHAYVLLFLDIWINHRENTNNNR